MTASEVKRYKGVPTLFINGKPRPAVWFGGASEYVASFASRRTGIPVYVISSDLSWVGPGKYDYTLNEGRVRKVLGEDREGYMIIQANCSVPGWWGDLYPQELTIYNDGETDRRAKESYASKLWKEETGEALTHYIKHFTGTRYGDRIIGYQIGGGFAVDWNKDKAQDGFLWDYSQVMREAFQEWVRKRYNDDISLVKATWRKNFSSFSDITVPEPAEQLNTDLFYFRDPVKSGYVIDYFLFRSELFADAMLSFLRTVKATGEKALLSGICAEYIMEHLPGAFYAAERFTNYDLNMVHNWSHQAFIKILRSPDVDFIVGWNTNLHRLAGGDGGPVSVPESAMLHDKLYITEFDTRTFLAGGPPDLGRIPTKEETIEVNRRDFCHMLTRGSVTLWGNLAANEVWYWPNIKNCNWYDDDGLVENIISLRKIAEQDLGLDDRASSAEICVVVDENSLAYHSLSANLLYALTTRQKAYEFCRIGAPYHVYLLDDLLSAELPEYKLYLFLNPFYLDEEKRRLIKKKVCREGKVVVWFYASGLINEEGLSAANVADLVGMKMVLDHFQWGLEISLVNFDHQITVNLPAHTRWSLDRDVGPIIYCDDPEVVVLGNLNYCNGRSNPGFCIREFPEWTSIYVGAPMVPSLILRNMAKLANVHIYSEYSDIVYANGNFLALHTNKPGRRLIRLRKRTNVWDVFEKKRIAQTTGSFVVDIAAKKTKLYYLGKRNLHS